MNSIYLDTAAFTQIDPEILQYMQEFYNPKYANPSSLHSLGINAKIALDKARKLISEQLNCTPREIIFTSGGTESNNFAIFAISQANKTKGNQIITTKIEHKSILNACKKLEIQDFKTNYLDINDEGQVNLDKIEELITKETILVSIIYANNEIGSIQNIKEIRKITKKHNTLLHIDACQATNYLKLDTKELDIDLMTINSSKIYGPVGIGLLYIKSGIKLNPQIVGGYQENKLRAGTENLPAIMGFSKALEIAQKNIEKNYKHSKDLQDLLEKMIIREIKGSKVNNNFKIRLPNISNIAFPKLNNKELLLLLDSFNIFVSTGSACNEGKNQNSHVLKNLKISEETSQKSLRFSIGKNTKKEEIDYTISILKKIFQKMNK